jgi:hypothetical protein
MRRIMYVENKRGGLDGDGRIGWVELSRSGRTYHYRGRHLAKTGSKDGADKLYGGIVQIDEDARVEYWTLIRAQPELVELTEYRAGASTRTAGTTRRNDERVRGRARN